ncbi:MAG: anhydro-N-acetylmuramic acid kinase [Chitinophagaceae bacterium]|nr:anhydro-N-acetylmuramic acid kinase [Chitinophagaceae bacterium]
MVYKVIGTMSGSSMDGLDIVFCELEEQGGKWTFDIVAHDCISFDVFWQKKLSQLINLSAKELLLTHTAFGKWMGEAIQLFIEKNKLEHKVHFIASHGHTVFHEPQLGMTFQMGDGAAIAAKTQLPVITDLRNMDVALGGQGAPIVPIGENLLWSEIKYFLNLGGIANISIHEKDQIGAFDICAANRILNLLANEKGKAFDENGDLARIGKLNQNLLDELNDVDYYQKTFPKSLSNEFGTNEIFSIVQKYNCSVEDKMKTYVFHICEQISKVLPNENDTQQILITGGGAKNNYFIETLKTFLDKKNIEIQLPEEKIIDNKEALVMALIGALRWREEINVLQSVTGAQKNSVGGALWMGQN